MTTARLRILETTDVHMHLMGFDYVTEKPVAHLGLANLAPMIAAAREDADLTLLFDNGDFLQGNPLAEHLASDLNTQQHHPVIAAMAALDYDAITLGNHEFDYGLDYLRDVTAQTDIPILCANLLDRQHKPIYPPWTVLDRQVMCADGEMRSIRIGVIGFVTPQIVDWDAHLLGGEIITEDIIAAARSYLPQLQREEIDLTVALCHSGIVADPYRPRMENAALPLAALPGIDVVLSGHTHDHFPSPQFDGIDGIDVARSTLHNKPAVMAGAFGSALGVIDLALRHSSDGWQIDDHAVTLQMTGSAPRRDHDAVAKQIDASLAAPHLATIAGLQRPLTTTPRRLTSYFAVLGLDDTAALLADAQRSAIRKALSATPFRELPILASTSSFRAGGHGGPQNYFDLPPGPLTRGDVAAIAPFDNPICAVVLRGWEIRQWLERTSAFFATIADPALDQPLINPKIAPYHFDTIHGLRYRIDLRVPPRPAEPGAGSRNRVRDLTLNGQALQDDQRFVVATSSYRAFGGGGQINVPADHVIHTSRQGIAAILGDQLAMAGVARHPPPRPWRFVRFRGGDLTFPTSPAASGVLDSYAEDGEISPLGRTDDGFQQYALRL